MTALAQIIEIKDYSKPVNPQKEDGYTPIANEVLDVLCKTDLSGGQRRCLDFILRKTYGFNKKEDDISYSQFAEGTGISIRKVREHIKALYDRNIITVHQNVHTHTAKKGFLSTTYRFNKQYDQWKDKNRVCTKTCTGVHENGKKVCTKTCNTKDNNKRKDIPSEFLTFSERFIEYSRSEFGNTAPKKTPSLVNTSAKTIRDLVEIDGFEFSFIQSVLRHTAKKEAWWHDKVKSLAGLRKKDTEGLTKFQKIVTSYKQEIKKAGSVNCDFVTPYMSPEEIKAAYQEKLKRGEL